VSRSIKYGDVSGERDGVEFATKKSMPSRSPPFGLMGLAGDLGAPACGSLVVADVPASPPPRSLIFPRKPHQQTSSYFMERDTIGVTVMKEACSLLFGGLAGT